MAFPGLHFRCVPSSGAMAKNGTQFRVPGSWYGSRDEEKLIRSVDPKGTFHFSQTVEALSYVETGRLIGKVVIYPIPRGN
ncbi:hypothetical protein SLE2022_280280 [Rubroshorea leprosula]